ncbi:MAG TPA: hypothetical protein VG168_17035 [Bryobacteraceae bacterium]|nr:hypothetical protein [Bryobacteraceae bacterium]
MTPKANQFQIAAVPSRTQGAFRERHGRWVRDAVAVVTSGARKRVDV